MTGWDRTPASAIPVSARSDERCDLEWALANYAGGRPLDPTCEFGFAPSGLDWSQPIIDLADVDPKMVTTRRAYPRYSYPPGNTQRGQLVTVVAGTDPCDSSDAQITYRYLNGDLVSLWAYSAPWTKSKMVTQAGGRSILLDLNDQFHGRAPFNPAVDIVAGSVEHIPAGDPGNTHCVCDCCGMGDGITTPAEVAAGSVGHFISMYVSSILSPGAPLIPTKGVDADITDPDDPRIGKYGCSSSPAPLIPRGAAGDQSKRIPTGQLFALTWGPADREAWADRRRYTGVLRATALTIAEALCVDVGWGWRNVAYSGTAKNPKAPAVIPFDGNPAAKDHWRALGITDGGAHLLDGLIVRERMVALRPPTAILASGALTHVQGPAVAIGYP